jgi:hypothetical protein
MPFLRWNSGIQILGLRPSWRLLGLELLGFPLEKRSVKNVSSVASFVGLPLEVDVNNLKKMGLC